MDTQTLRVMVLTLLGCVAGVDSCAAQTSRSPGPDFEMSRPKVLDGLQGQPANNIPSAPAPSDTSSAEVILVCTGSELSGVGSGGSHDSYYVFNLTVDIARGIIKYNDGPVESPTINNNEITFIIPANNPLLKVFRASGDIITLGNTQKIRRMRIDRRVGTFSSGLANGTCQPSTSKGRMF